MKPIYWSVAEWIKYAGVKLNDAHRLQSVNVRTIYPERTINKLLTKKEK